MDQPQENWKGNWFHRLGWRVFPKARSLEVRALVKKEKDAYCHQLEWSLAEIDASNKNESRLIAQEFLDAARSASEQCPLLLGVNLSDRRKHGWKHVTYRDVELVAKKALNPPAAAMRFVRWSLSTIQKLFSDAANRDPRAVARLTFVFPDDDEKQRIARYYMSKPGSVWNGARIPSAGDLLAECVATVYRNPNSTAADEARRIAEILLSKKAASGLTVKAGQPGVFMHPGYLKESLIIGQALFKQLGQITALLKRFDGSDVSRDRFLLELYPFLNLLQEEGLLAFLEMHPRDAAFCIVQTLLKESRSKIENRLYPPRSRS